MGNNKIVIEKGIFIPGAVVLIVMILFGFAFLGPFNQLMTVLYNATTTGFGWFYLIMSFFLFFFTLAIAFTKFGNKKLGGEEAKPEHNIFTWCAMTICCGIATAVVFYAVGEPLTYFHTPPVFTGLTGGTAAAGIRAIQIAAFHWGYIYYGMFTFWGLAAGYMVYNYNLPPRPSSALYPVLKDKIYGPIGKVIDVLSLLALIGGMVTSLGFGAQQFASGLQYVFGIKPTNLIYVVTILVVTLSYTASSGRGIKKGMAMISDANAYIYIILLIFLYIAGNTVFQLDLTVQVIGSTITNFIGTALNADAFNVGQGWTQGHTVFFMAWIMAYAPLIGVFLAKISQGRTIRQFLLVNIFVPGTFVLFWFCGFGGNAIYQDMYNNANIIGEIDKMGFPVANFALLGHMPLKVITIPIVILALFFSFITLADAMTGTMASMSLKNVTDDEAPVAVKLFWGILSGGATILCLFCLGTSGTTSLQNMSIVYALPIFIISIFAVKSVIRIVNGSFEKEMSELKKTEKINCQANETERMEINHPEIVTKNDEL